MQMESNTGMCINFATSNERKVARIYQMLPHEFSNTMYLSMSLETEEHQGRMY